MFVAKLLLDRKREGCELSPDEVREFVGAYVRGEVPDYQMAAFLMAVCCRGMTAAETLALTESMRDSGSVVDWGDGLPTADKHSTGGVGDKLSMIIQPLAAACGLRVPSLTGRGLGITGGTADKLESIPGYNASLDLADFRKVVDACGCSMTVQTAEIAPADKGMYALRDVTGTVPSIPLITASILSKKLAEGAGTLVFDVKAGRGAFMRTFEDAKALAESLVGGARGAGRKSAALVTRMDVPLGYAVGNALEIEESVAVLKGAAGGRGDADFNGLRQLSVTFAAKMVELALGVDASSARATCEENLGDGSAHAKFAEMVRLQGGDLDAFAAKCERLHADEGAQAKVLASHDGFVADVDAFAAAVVALDLGAGRKKADDEIDMGAGVVFAVRRGDRVAKGDLLATLYAPKKRDLLGNAVGRLSDAIAISDVAPEAANFVLEEIG